VSAQERWCERCELWLGPSLVLPDGRCALHLVSTETAEQIRRDRDACRAKVRAHLVALRAFVGGNHES
jgi:hypothetical protein